MRKDLYLGEHIWVELKTDAFDLGLGFGLGTFAIELGWITVRFF